MAAFLDTVTVVEHGGAWTFGNKFPITYFDRAFETGISDICNPAPFNEGPDVEFGEDVYPVAVLGYMKSPTRCTPDEFDTLAATAMRHAVEHQVSKLLWTGTDVVDDYTLFLAHPDIDTVDRETTHAATVAAVLAQAYQNTPHLSPLLHLGTEVAVSLGIGLRNLGINYVTAPGYPVDAVAVTDSSAASGITVHLSPIEAATSTQTDINRHQVELSRFAAIEFDKFRAVRAA